jgi:hypothetical protein
VGLFVEEERFTDFVVDFCELADEFVSLFLGKGNKVGWNVVLLNNINSLCSPVVNSLCSNEIHNTLESIFIAYWNLNCGSRYTKFAAIR